jgi:hypothetical protein
MQSDAIINTSLMRTTTDTRIRNITAHAYAWSDDSPDRMWARAGHKARSDSWLVAVVENWWQP